MDQFTHTLRCLLWHDGSNDSRGVQIRLSNGGSASMGCSRTHTWNEFGDIHNPAFDRGSKHGRVSVQILSREDDRALVKIPAGNVGIEFWVREQQLQPIRQAA